MIIKVDLAMFIYINTHIIYSLQVDKTQIKDPDKILEQNQCALWQRSQTRSITDKHFLSRDCLLSVVSELLFLYSVCFSMVGARR